MEIKKVNYGKLNEIQTRRCWECDASGGLSQHELMVIRALALEECPSHPGEVICPKAFLVGGCNTALLDDCIREMVSGV
jgi:hypothetical protein